MESRDKIIIISLLVVIIAIVVGMALFTFNNSQSTQIDVLGNGTIEDGGVLNVKLSTSNGTGLENKKLHVIISNSKDKVVLNKSVKTNSKGKASVDLENVSKGKYTVNITFDGDENYSANTTSKNIKIIEKKEVETTPENEVVQEDNEPVEASSSEPQDPNDWDGDGMPDIFYSESYNDEDGLVQYYDTRDGQRLTVYEDGEYYLEDSNGYVDSGYF